MAHILIVEDEKSINDLIAMNLALVGHTSDQAYDGNEALEFFKNNIYSLIIMDVMLPGPDGFTLMQHVPENTQVIFLTAMGNLADRVKGLKLGADDYIVKPFETVELLARIEAVLRRTQKSCSTFSLDGTVIDLKSRVVTVNGCETELTLREYELLEILIKNKNIALTREKLLKLAWEYDYFGETRTVDVHIQKLRKKLNWDKIGQPVENVYKTLVTQGTSREYYVFIIPVAKELNLKAAAKAVGEKAVEMIRVADITKVTGYIRGGCSPMGMKKDYKTVLDSSCLLLDFIIISAGKPGHQIMLHPNDLIKLINCRTEHITM